VTQPPGGQSDRSCPRQNKRQTCRDLSKKIVEEQSYIVIFRGNKLHFFWGKMILILILFFSFRDSFCISELRYISFFRRTPIRPRTFVFAQAYLQFFISHVFSVFSSLSSGWISLINILFFRQIVVKSQERHLSSLSLVFSAKIKDVFRGFRGYFVAFLTAIRAADIGIALIGRGWSEAALTEASWQ